VSADQTPSTNARVRVADAEKAEAKEELVCERIAETGTRLSKRVCKTRAQWDADRANAKEATDAIQRDGLMQKDRGN
jgi:hypothetical protein